jgi:arabinan endo-1,5-alpha-L-arabinosidase
MLATTLIASGPVSPSGYTSSVNLLNSGCPVQLAQSAYGLATASKKQAESNPTPMFRDAAVHDPSVLKVGTFFYVFGSHLAAAKTKNFMQWDKVADGVNPTNPLFENVLEDLKEAFAWSQTQALWAADVIQLKDGRFYMYYNAAKGDSPRSALGVAVADSVEGPYRNQGILLKSGMWGQLSEDGTVYDPRLHPNAVDPDVFYDNEGKLWMIYGSYSGGLFILKMDAITGKPLPAQGYGKKLIGGNHSAIEGGYVMYHPQTKFYYMFSSFGGLGAASGYNMRVARSRRPDGPYLDAAEIDMICVKADPTKPLFDDRSIEPYGVKVMGNFQFKRELGDPGEGNGIGYLSPGHNSAFYDSATGKQFLIFHTRFPDQGEGHQIRVHQMFMNREGWPVIAPYRYAGETIGPIKDAVSGSYKYINHGKAISPSVNTSRAIRLEQNGRITGAVSGAWKRDGTNGVVITLGDVKYNGVFARLWEPETQSYVLTFSALSKQGVAIWGSRMVEKSDAKIVADVQRQITLGDTGNDIISNLLLPTRATRQTNITWASSNPKVITPAGIVLRPQTSAGNARVTLTATIKRGNSTAQKVFPLTVRAKSAGGLVAHYSFEGNLAEANDRAGGGLVTGNRIDNTGGTITFAPGVRGNAAVFDGSSGIRLPQGLIANSAYSVALWVKPEQLTRNTTTFFGGRDPGAWISLVPMGHDKVNNGTLVWTGTTVWSDAPAGKQIRVGQWTHLTFSVQDGAIVLYVDGVQQFKGTNFSDVLTTTTGTFGLGVNWWDAPFKGLIDELRIYESVLTAEEVAALAAGAP